MSISAKTNYRRSSPVVYLAGGQESDPKQCTSVHSGTISVEPLLESSLEEADDRLMVNIRYVCEKFRNSHIGNSTVLVYSPDTDILVMLLYHLKSSIQNNATQERDAAVSTQYSLGKHC